MFFVSCAPHHHYFLKMIFAIKSFLKLKKKTWKLLRNVILALYNFLLFCLAMVFCDDLYFL